MLIIIFLVKLGILQTVLLLFLERLLHPIIMLQPMLIAIALVMPVTVVTLVTKKQKKDLWFRRQIESSGEWINLIRPFLILAPIGHFIRKLCG
jgi:hypothetical protein